MSLPFGCVDFFNFSRYNAFIRKGAFFMKRRFVFLLLLALLLSGCGKPAEPTKPAEALPTETEPIPTQTEPLPALLEGRAPVGDTENLWYIPNEIVESMGYPEMHMLGGNLLLSQILEEDAGSKLELKLVSTEDGALLAENAISCTGGMQVQTLENGVGLCDFAGCRVLLLDEKLNVLHTYDVESENEAWQLSSDGNTLYRLHYDTGLTARDLESGEETALLGQVANVRNLENSNDYLLFSYVDREDQRSKYRCLEMKTGEMTAVPAVGFLGMCSRSKDVWLMNGWKNWMEYRIVSGEESKKVVCTEGSLELTSTGQLLFTSESGRGLTLYTKDGSFVSRCALPETENNDLGMSFVWSDNYHGYFFTETQDADCRLLFWDISVPTAGDALALETDENVIAGGALVDKALYTRAAELSAQFGVEICIAEKCQADYDQYYSYILEDASSISEALDVLETTLGTYPKGFFEQLNCGTIEKIRIELVGALDPKEGSNMVTADAFTQAQGDYHLLAADGRFLTADTVYHEIAHIIDHRLAWDAQFREDALFSEEVWLSLQPEGFDYAYSYTETPESVAAYCNSGYFMSQYACTYPTEDRATMMASAAAGFTWSFAENPGLIPKLEYYSQCIRDCFDTTGWPETLPWESVLEN